MDDLMWRLARREIQLRIQLRVGEKSAELLAQHNSIAMIVSQALGGGKASGPPPKVGDTGVKNVIEGHGDVNSAVAAINAAMRF